MPQWIITFAINHDWLIYGLIVVLACAEGPILSVCFGVILQLGYLYFIPVYAALMMGDLVGDVIWYWIGHRYGHRFIARFGHKFGIDEDKVYRVTRLFHRYKYYVLFISKISNGFGFALVTLMTAGMVRIPFGKYLTVNLVGQFIWSGMLLAVGYYFSNAFAQIDSWFGRIGLIAGVGVAAFIVYHYWKQLRIKAEKLGASEPPTDAPAV